MFSASGDAYSTARHSHHDNQPKTHAAANTNSDGHTYRSARLDDFSRGHAFPGADRHCHAAPNATGDTRAYSNNPSNADFCVYSRATRECHRIRSGR